MLGLKKEKEGKRKRMGGRVYQWLCQLFDLSAL